MTLTDLEHRIALTGLPLDTKASLVYSHVRDVARRHPTESSEYDLPYCEETVGAVSGRPGFATKRIFINDPRCASASDSRFQGYVSMTERGLYETITRLSRMPKVAHINADIRPRLAGVGALAATSSKDNVSAAKYAGIGAAVGLGAALLLNATLVDIIGVAVIGALGGWAVAAIVIAVGAGVATSKAP